MWHHKHLDNLTLHSLIRRRLIQLGGNRHLGIYGSLICKSGERMRKDNRVFFSTSEEAIRQGYRPCGHCLPTDYKLWKQGNMQLFENTPDPARNLLPQDGAVHYFGKILPRDEADSYLKQLLETIEWKNDEAVIFGKHMLTKRKVAWYGDQPFEYTYSNTTKLALPWTPALRAIKKKIETISGETFNSCLLNLYHNGTEGMAWHSDGEKDLKKDGAIGSVSFGAERKFAFKHKKTKETIRLVLEHGSLLIMKGSTQTHWLHRLPPTQIPFNERVNLTFRTIEH